jgi:hypothetical protein
MDSRMKEHAISMEITSEVFQDDPLHPNLKSIENDYTNSLKKIVTMEADILCEGHYGIIEGKKPIVEFINSYI